MRFLDTILRTDPEARRFRSASRGAGRCVGDGIEAADVAFFGPLVFDGGLGRARDEEV
ncbi:hypothetical protein [Isoptericola sp. BMS4]|uniref:hypothetical protein n=1 Tax=Isoptericola sp. BMS4 TaxID=2527875 RepID=UPI00142313B5|nr:hypothetical protein [Isoptericola sp. BMS4]